MYLLSLHLILSLWPIRLVGNLSAVIIGDLNPPGQCEILKTLRSLAHTGPFSRPPESSDSNQSCCSGPGSLWGGWGCLA